MGYVACGVLLNEKDELLRLVINSVRNDLLSRNEAFQCLALHFVANVGGVEFAQLMTGDVMNVISNGATRPVVRKKAALCLLRMLRNSPADSELISSSEWGPRMATLLEERDLGVLLGLTTLLLGIVSRSYEGYESCVPRLVALLERLKSRDISQDYTYYGLPSPWLQVRILRLLQYFPPPEDPAILTSLTDSLRRILAGNEPVKNPNKSNAVHAIAFEGVAVAVALEDPELVSLGLGLMARFLTVREANLRYLALENFARLAANSDVGDAVASHHKTVLSCLHDLDPSIRRRALDLMFTTASEGTAPSVVDELLAALPRADVAMREEIVLKAAILAERFPPSHEWYVDSMLRLMLASGDISMDDVWHSVVQLVASESDLPVYAVQKILDGLRQDKVTESFLRCASFILGDHGREHSEIASIGEQFNLLHARFPSATVTTKAMLLTCYEKFRALCHDDKTKGDIDQVFERHKAAINVELQQRAVEYQSLDAHPSLSTVALQPLPAWEKRASLLLRRLAEREGEVGDEAREMPVWMTAGETNADASSQGQKSAKPVELASGPPQTSATEAKKEPAAQVPAVPDLLDLLDLNDNVPAEKAPVDVTSSAADPLAFLEVPSEPVTASLPRPGPVVGASANPFAEDVAVEPAAAPAIEPTVPREHAPPQVQPVGDVDAWFRVLCQRSSGVLYEDPHLQIGVRMTGLGAKSEVGVYLGNKSPHQLNNLSFRMIPPSHEGVEAMAISMSPAPITLEPGKQVHVPAQLTCLSPYTTNPVVHLGYELLDGVDGGGIVNRTLEFPVVLTKFCEPVEVPASVFNARWSQVGGPPYKLKEMIPSGTPSVVGRGSVVDLLGALHLRVLEGVDPTPTTVCAACVLHCSGSKINQIPCMVKVEGLETDASGAAVTVATADAKASEGLVSLLARQLRGLQG